jgi:hypothetical protein
MTARLSRARRFNFSDRKHFRGTSNLASDLVLINYLSHNLL